MRAPRNATTCTTCSGAPARCSTASTTAGSRRRSCASGARSACGSATPSCSSRSRTRGSCATRSASCRPAACRRSSSSRSSTPCARCSGGTRGRTARSRPPRSSTRFGLDAARVEAELAALERDDELVRGELRPGGTEREWCDPDVLRRIRRATLAVLRREVEPAEQAAFGRFLPAWHGIGRRQSLREALVPLQGVRAAGDALGERRAAAARALVPAGRSRRALRVGRGRVGRRRARSRRRLLPRRRAAARAAAGEASPEGEAAVADSRRARRARALLGRPRRLRPRSRPRTC